MPSGASDVPLLWRARRPLQRGFLVFAAALVMSGALLAAYGLIERDVGIAAAGIALAVGGAVVMVQRRARA